MRIRIRVSNYRCFPAHPPAEFEFGDGITAFIGENNAGKSAAMRLIHDLRPVFKQASAPDGLNLLVRSPLGLSNGEEVRDSDEIFFNGGTGPLVLTLENCDAISRAERALPPMGRLTLTRDSQSGWSAAWPDAEQPMLVDSAERTYEEERAGVLKGDAKPILDTVRALASAVYIPSTRHVIGGDASSFDVPIGDSLVSKWDEISRGLAKKDNAAADDVERSLAALFGLQGLRAIPTVGTNGRLQFKIDGTGQFRSDELGAGLAQVFSALFVVATRKPSLVMIDEPELSLHPPLQFRFLTELQRFASLGLAFSTHNLGLAMNAADRVYSVIRQDGRRDTGNRPWSRITSFEESPDLAAVLGALSYPTYGDAGARHVLLVEGPTDSRAMQVLLQKLGVADRVICVHMGGSTTIVNAQHARTQLSGIKRLCARTWCLIDGEGERAGQLCPQRRVFLALCEEMGIVAHATERRATENYVSDSACKKAFGGSASVPSHHEKLSMQIHGWSKQQIWKAIGTMELSALGDLGQFLEAIARAVHECSNPEPPHSR